MATCHCGPSTQIRTWVAQVHALLQQPEVRTPRLVEGDEFTVQEQRAAFTQAGGGDLGVAGGDVIAVAAADPHLPTGRGHDRAHPTGVRAGSLPWW